jgi:RHS repeat-associated protein
MTSDQCFEYCFGFNGKELDNEVSGSGNTIAYEARIYDSRLGRFLSTDPWEYKYAWQSSYAYFKNSPISTIDFLGKGEGDEKLPTPKAGTNDQSIEEVLVQAKRETVEEKAARGIAIYPQPAPELKATTGQQPLGEDKQSSGGFVGNINWSPKVLGVGIQVHASDYADVKVDASLFNLTGGFEDGNFFGQYGFVELGLEA